MNKPKNYYYSKYDKKWVVQKTINKIQRQFGKYPTEKHAQKAVELFNEINWDQNKKWEVRAKVYEVIKK